MTKQDIAVLDLGSNSFHMIVAQLEANQNLRIIDKIKQDVRLAEGLDENRYLKTEMIERALQFLDQLRERLEDFNLGSVRIVGTDTLRRAKNGELFLAQAADRIGWPIEIISGMEEARLIYHAVATDSPSARKRLVVDIGGGSTEVIVGEGAQPIYLSSTHMGCVSWTKKYFQNDQSRKRQFQNAIGGAQQQLFSVFREIRQSGWEEAIGTSGTIRSISDYLRVHNLSDGTITKHGLEYLRHTLLKDASTELLGISMRRMEVLPGGLSILLGLFDILRIKELKPHPSALREGVLNELVGRIIGADIRDQSVEAMSTRMSVDKAQALRVETFAMKLFDQAAEDWGLEESDRTLLSWAARLHEVGRSIAFSGYHNHGGYILHNADMAGFSRFDQSRLAVLVKFHRGKIRFDEMRSLCPSLEKSHHNILLLLRLATRLHRRRSHKPLPEFVFKVYGNQVTLYIPPEYHQDRPLSYADLREEQRHLKKLGFDFYLEERDEIQ